MGLLTHVRSAITGRYVSRQEAAQHPESTVVESDDRVRRAARELLAAYEGDDTGRTQPLDPYFEQLRQALNS